MIGSGLEDQASAVHEDEVASTRLPAIVRSPRISVPWHGKPG